MSQGMKPPAGATSGLPPRGPYLISFDPVIVRASTGVTCLETRFLRTAPEYIMMLRSHFLHDEILHRLFNRVIKECDASQLTLIDRTWLVCVID